MTTLSMHRSRAGFTLIEILTVLVISGILASMAAPALNGYVERQREARVRNQITNDLSQARMLAIRAGDRVSVVRHSATRYSIGLATAPDAGRRQVRLEGDYPGISVAFPAAGQIVFNSRGIVDVGTGVINVTLNGRTHGLQVSATGRTYPVGD